MSDFQLLSAEDEMIFYSELRDLFTEFEDLEPDADSPYYRTAARAINLADHLSSVLFHSNTNNSIYTVSLDS